MDCTYCEKLDKLHDYFRDNLKYCVDCRGYFCDIFIGEGTMCDDCFSKIRKDVSSNICNYCKNDHKMYKEKI